MQVERNLSGAPLITVSIELDRTGLSQITNVDNAIHSPNLVEHIRARRRVQVDQVIGDIPAALVEEVSHIEISVAQDVENVTQGAGCVAVGNRNS